MNRRYSRRRWASTVSSLTVLALAVPGVAGQTRASAAAKAGQAVRRLATGHAGLCFLPYGP